MMCIYTEPTFYNIILCQAFWLAGLQKILSLKIKFYLTGILPDNRSELVAKTFYLHIKFTPFKVDKINKYF